MKKTPQDLQALLGSGGSIEIGTISISKSLGLSPENFEPLGFQTRVRVLLALVHYRTPALKGRSNLKTLYPRGCSPSLSFYSNNVTIRLL